jgi:hypothetical protein
VEGVEIDMRRLFRQAGGFRTDPVDRSVQALQSSAGASSTAERTSLIWQPLTLSC